MAPVATCHEQRVIAELRAELSSIPAVVSVHCKMTDAGLAVTVGIDQDGPQIRDAVYSVEESLANRCRDPKINFRVIALPHGKTTGDYVSSRPIYQRNAA